MSEVVQPCFNKNGSFKMRTTIQHQHNPVSTLKRKIWKHFTHKVISQAKNAMNSKLKIILTASVIIFLFYSLLTIKITHMEVMVEGWGYNTTRDTSQYILATNLSAYILPGHFCDPETFLIVMVCSGPSNFEARNAIRETWGRDHTILGNNVSLFFLLGETANTTLQADVILESEKYGDIVQERFIDSYNNLTIKSIVMLKLVSSYCTNYTKYLLKIDDDMFVNMDLIMEMLMQRNVSKNYLAGKLICGASPIKDTTSKWYSPRYMYPGKLYPNYLSGTGYLMSVDVSKKLYKTALETPIFHLEDVYLTGICAKKARIKPQNNPLFTYQKLNHDVCLIRKLQTAHRFSPENIRKTYSQINDANTITECQHKNAFNVNNWFVNNILKVNKTRRKSKCG